jgi:hypothetical protein
MIEQLEKKIPISNRVVIEHIARRIGRNANALILVVGDVGSGKSYFAMDFGMTLADRFSCSFDMSWVGFTAQKTLEVVLREHKRGQPILLDEMGVAMGSRRFMTKENVGLSFVLQTVRFMNQCILFTVPELSFVDIHARKLFHYIALCKPRFRGDKNFVSVKKIEKSKKDPNKIYFRAIPYRAEDGAIKYAGTYTTTKPPKWLVDDYERVRGEYIRDMYNKQKEIMEGGQAQGKKKEEKTSKPCPFCNNIIEASSNFCTYCGGTVQ